MGPEYIVIALAVIGFFIFLWLLYLTCRPIFRSYALSVFLFSCISGFWFSHEKSSANFTLYFLIGFLGGVVIFGTHALLIVILKRILS